MAADIGEDEFRDVAKALLQSPDKYPKKLSSIKPDIHLKIRLKPALVEHLKRAAAKDGVSINQEIVNRLLRSFVEDAVLERYDLKIEGLDQRVHYLEVKAFSQPKEEDDQRPQGDTA